MIRQASAQDAVAIARLLHTALQDSVEGNFSINKQKLLDHVVQVITTADGFAQVYEAEGKVVGCFMAQLEPHAYVNGYIASELGVYINPEHRGTKAFIQLLNEFIAWSAAKPDVLFTTFNIGQWTEDSDTLARLLTRKGFQKANEGFYRL